METILINRKRFLEIVVGTVLVIGATSKLVASRNRYKIVDMDKNEVTPLPLKEDEIEILHLASLAPSGHNTQPWFVKYIKPYHYIICNDKSRWLSAVDPNQRETILSIGAFVQNLEYAAIQMGYDCEINILGASNQDKQIAEVKLKATNQAIGFDTSKIKHRRVVRSNYLNDALKNTDIDYLKNGEPEFIYFFDNSTKEHQWLNEQTIEANKLQAYRDDAQQELANWIRFSIKDARQHKDGLTMASMEIGGISGWILRHFYHQADVMKKDFREKAIETVKLQVSQSAGWFLITSKDNSVASLLETGKRLQRMLLKIRERSIAIHPMTQILEEPSTNQKINKALRISEPIQFILRVGYVNEYPQPVSLRREVERFVRV
ncbi:MAG: Acg family FMN-binding oxidoreductase [Cytophagales bacterium]